MRIGVVVPMAVSDGPGQVPTWPQVRTFGQHAEAVGLDSVWVCDHLLSGRPEEGIHEGWTILAALATSTRRLEQVRVRTPRSTRGTTRRPWASRAYRGSVVACCPSTKDGRWMSTGTS